MAGVNKQTVNNWRRRSKDMPAPAAVLRCGPIWFSQDVRRWLINIGFTHLRQ